MYTKHNTSWQQVHQWYDTSVGSKGNYFHEHVIIPKVITLLKLKSDSSILDLGCGQGILGRSVPKNIQYYGIDSSRSLIESAKLRDKNRIHYYMSGDVTEMLHIEKGNFSHATLILSLQNMKNGKGAIEQASKHLLKNGNCIIVLNHPCFRIPRQTSWGIDEKNKLQYRKIFRYLSPIEIPITMHPGKEKSPVTWTYHHPLSTYSQWLFETGFEITKIEEWSSDKESVGRNGKMENRARSEIPLFLTIVAKKNH
jgi:ubiquinone/menaquinone biosynthesis C-methylase UbiE